MAHHRALWRPLPRLLGALCAAGVLLGLAGPGRSMVSLPLACHINVTLTGAPIMAFTVPVDLGTPARTFNLLLDTGSSNTAVAGPDVDPGTGNTFAPAASSTFTELAEAITVTYALGSITADLFSDVATVGGLTPQRVTLGLITTATDFFRTSYDGILGAAYPAAVQGSDGQVPLLEALAGADTLLSVQLCDLELVAATTTAARPGLLTLGGVAAGTTIGTMRFTPIVREVLYGINITSLRVDGDLLDVTCGQLNSPGPSIVDTGTTNIFLPQDVYDAFEVILRPKLDFGTNDEFRERFFAGEGCAIVPDAVLNSLPVLTFGMPEEDTGLEFFTEVHPWQYLRLVQASSTEVCRVLGVRPHCSNGFGAILGIVYMTRYTVAFDRNNTRLGFAASTCGTQEAGDPLPAAIAAPTALPSTGSCDPVFSSCSSSSGSSLSAASIAGITVGAIVLLLVLAAIVYMAVTLTRKPSSSHSLGNEMELAEQS